MVKICKFPILNMASSEKQTIKVLVIDALILIKYKYDSFSFYGVGHVKLPKMSYFKDVEGNNLNLHCQLNMLICRNLSEFLE